MRVEVHDRAALRWQLIAGVVLGALLITLATLQYRWLGEVSEAERARMRDTLQTRAADLTAAFDRELTQIYVAFHGDPVTEDDPARTIGGELARARASVAIPGLIKELFLLEADGDRAGVLRRFNPETRTLEPAEWPATLDRLKAKTVRPADPPTPFPPLFLADAVDAAAPALIIPVPFMKRFESGAGRIAVLPDPGGRQRTLVVWLDANLLRHDLLQALVTKYFGADGESEFVVSVVERDNPSRIVFTSSNDVVVDERADVSTGMFDLRMNELTRVGGGGDHDGGRGLRGTTDRLAVTIVRRSNGPGNTARLLMTGGAGQGAWLVRARYRRGSLESIVASSRRRNLAISAGILGLLGAAFALVVAAAQRQRRLARQQMEFVASVSHELRTPLAVICSAGENLADGVVADAAQIKTYGALIGTEGRRLGDMVERVMEFAGISSGAPIRARAGVDAARLVADAVQSVIADAEARQVTVVVRANRPLPALTADPDALRSAMQNIVGNAVKYSASGGSVEVTIEAGNGAVEVRVADRGLGIDPSDLPHVFQPFYRGRRAVDAQVRGTGVGLSVVHHVIAAHRGTVDIDSRPGEGTTVTVKLPA